MAYPSKTYKVDLENQRIIGSIDGAEAVWQFVHKTLSTDKYYWLNYDENFGIKNMQRLVGKSREYIETQIPRYMEQALLTDDRIEKITDYEFDEISPSKLFFTCRIWTIYGDKKISKEIDM